MNDVNNRKEDGQIRGMIEEKSKRNVREMGGRKEGLQRKRGVRGRKVGYQVAGSG